MSFAERLSKLRNLADGLSNAELDRLSGLRKGHTWALERNPNANPELHTIQTIATTLGCPVGYLASGEGDGPTPAAVQSAVDAARRRFTENESASDAKRGAA